MLAPKVRAKLQEHNTFISSHFMATNRRLHRSRRWQWTTQHTKSIAQSHKWLLHIHISCWCLMSNVNNSSHGWRTTTICHTENDRNLLLQSSSQSETQSKCKHWNIQYYNSFPIEESCACLKHYLITHQRKTYRSVVPHNIKHRQATA